MDSTDIADNNINMGRDGMANSMQSLDLIKKRDEIKKMKIKLSELSMGLDEIDRSLEKDSLNQDNIDSMFIPEDEGMGMDAAGGVQNLGVDAQGGMGSSAVEGVETGLEDLSGRLADGGTGGLDASLGGAFAGDLDEDSSGYSEKGLGQGAAEGMQADVESPQEEEFHANMDEAEEDQNNAIMSDGKVDLTDREIVAETDKDQDRMMKDHELDHENPIPYEKDEEEDEEDDDEEEDEE